MNARLLTLAVLAFLVALAPIAIAADYWPGSGARTYVFGDGARLVFEPLGGDLANFRVFAEDCAFSWPATVEPNGRLTVPSGVIDCVTVGPDPVELEFEGGGEVLFDPEWIGETSYKQIQGTADGESVSIYVRVGAPRTIAVGGAEVEAVEFAVSAFPTPFPPPILTIDLSRTEGPVRVDGIERTAVLEGIVDGAVSSWSALKARFER